MVTAAAVMAALIIIILFCPLSYSAHIKRDAQLRYRARIGLPFLYLSATGNADARCQRLHLLGHPMGQGSDAKSRRDGKDDPGRTERRKGGGEDRGGKAPPVDGGGKSLGITVDMITKENLHHVGRLLRALYQTLQPSVLQIRLRVGLGEPDLNGMALALYHSLRNLFPSLPVSWTTIWEDEEFEGEGRIEGAVVLVRLLWVLVPFILSRRTLRLLLQIKRQRKRHRTAGWETILSHIRGNRNGGRTKNAGEHVQ